MEMESISINLDRDQINPCLYILKKTPNVSVADCFQIKLDRVSFRTAFFVILEMIVVVVIIRVRNCRSAVSKYSVASCRA